MRTIELVRSNTERLRTQLKSEIDRGAEKRSKIFPEWVAGKVLLDEEATKSARESASNGDLAMTARGVYDSFFEMNEERLVPALTFTKHGRPIFVLILQPSYH